jgi:protein SCO1/2
MRRFVFLGFQIMICLVVLISTQVVSQDMKDTEVGVVEKLDSIIPLKLIFDDEQAAPVAIGTLVNKPTILSFVYYACPGICPALLSGMSDVMERIDMQLGKDYDVITVSFNPNDTPAEAIQKKQNYLRSKSKPYAGNWHYLTGDSASIHKLTNAAGFFYKQAGVDFIHPSCIVILSPTGKITRYLYGTSFLPFDLKMALIEAQKGQSRPTINRVLEFCFNYDPEGRRYTLQVTKISATIIIFFALFLLIVLIFRSNRKKSKTQKT